MQPPLPLEILVTWTVNGSFYVPPSASILRNNKIAVNYSGTRTFLSRSASSKFCRACVCVCVCVCVQVFVCVCVFSISVHVDTKIFFSREKLRICLVNVTLLCMQTRTTQPKVMYKTHQLAICKQKIQVLYESKREL